MSNFSFSQSSLQDFVECPRRFELRYLQKVRWPGYIKDQPADLRRSMELGNQFHLFCQQVFSGVPEILIRQSIHDPALQEWWENFSVWRNDWLKDGQFFPEITLHTHIAGQRVLAKYDLIALQSSGLQIYDWKTSPARTSRLWLRQKIQTILYPLLMCLAGQNISSGLAAPAPESVMMTYWFANHPSDPEILPYSSIQFEDDLQYITNLIVGKELGHWVPLMIDVQGYRHRREMQLRKLARRMAEQALHTGRRQVLEPMPANERRLIHLELRDFPGVQTESIGEEPVRKVTIFVKK